MRVARAGCADMQGAAGTAPVRARWHDLGGGPLPTKLPWRKAFPAPFPEIRRLDPLAAYCCVAVEAAGGPFPSFCALVLATAHGCLEADRRFVERMEDDATIQPSVFPYTLPSSALGVLAIRHRIHGPCLCLGTAPGGEGAALREAETILDAGEAPAAIALMGDALPREGRALMTALLLLPEEPRPDDPMQFADLLHALDPTARVAACLRWVE